MPTIKQKKAFDKSVENRGNITKAMRDAGYSEATINNPKDLTDSLGWKELLEKHLSENKLTQVHEELLNSSRLDHMVFPLGPKKNAEKKEGEDSLSDEDIILDLKSVNCTVRRIVHGETARHVYFWANDNKARKEALDMAYKLRGSYAPEKSLNVSINANIMDDEELVELANKLNEVARPPITRKSVSSDGVDSNAVDAKTQV